MRFANVINAILDVIKGPEVVALEKKMAKAERRREYHRAYRARKKIEEARVAIGRTHEAIRLKINGWESSRRDDAHSPIARLRKATKIAMAITNKRTIPTKELPRRFEIMFPGSHAAINKKVLSVRIPGVTGPLKVDINPDTPPTVRAVTEFALRWAERYGVRDLRL